MYPIQSIVMGAVLHGIGTTCCSSCAAGSAGTSALLRGSAAVGPEGTSGLSDGLLLFGSEFWELASITVPKTGGAFVYVGII